MLNVIHPYAQKYIHDYGPISEEDGKKAFEAFVNRFNEIGSQKGLSVRLPK